MLKLSVLNDIRLSKWKIIVFISSAGSIDRLMYTDKEFNRIVEVKVLPCLRPAAETYDCLLQLNGGLAGNEYRPHAALTISRALSIDCSRRVNEPTYVLFALSVSDRIVYTRQLFPHNFPLIAQLFSTHIDCVNVSSGPDNLNPSR